MEDSILEPGLESSPKIQPQSAENRVEIAVEEQRQTKGQERQTKGQEMQTKDPQSWTEVLSQCQSVSFEMFGRNRSAFGDNSHETFRFLRGCKVSPDSLCLLTNSSDNRLRLFEMPNTETQMSDEKDDLSPCLTMKENELIYDFCWFPGMNSSQPDSCCLVCTSQYQPIHLYDAYDGSIRATYRCFNHLDELVAAQSLAFSHQGDKLYAGLKNEIRIFDVAVAGKNCELRKTWTKKEGGQPGIISSIATNPVLNEVYALGSFSKTCGVYLEPNGQLLCLLEGQKGGLTHLQFSPDGSKLLAGGRKDNDILVWDMRNPGTLYSVLQRKVDTNQRIYFDIHPNDPNLVISGSTDGTISMWDLTQPPSSAEKSGDPVLKPFWARSDLHEDCVNGVSFVGNSKNLEFASVSGQRHFPHQSFISDDEEEVEEIKNECQLKLWRFPELSTLT